ncbi:hypothetical protein XENOCAPTIV_028944, partial [Xenoophorus captivus]
MQNNVLWNRRHCAVTLWGTYVSRSRSAPSLKATDESKLYSGVRAVSCIMLKSSSKQSGLYRDKLLPDAKRRYLEKIAKIGNVDPFELRNWSRDPEHLPPLTFPDIFAYLVCGVSVYTATNFKNYKSMEAHVQFANGWVHDLDIFNPLDCEYVVVRTIDRGTHLKL